nr:LysR family transcriptional regulator [uncultured Anaeromusa sp.]
MNDKDWFIIKTIANKKNITVAADYLYMTQPALTYRLKCIEGEVGAKLFLRTSKGVLLTPQGEVMVEYAQRMLAELKRTQLFLSGMKATVQGRLELGVASSFANHKLSPLLKEFSALYSQVELSITSGASGAINQLLQREEISVGIMRGEYAWPEGKHLWSEEPICLTADEAVALEELPSLPYIHYETDRSYQKAVAAWWNERFAAPPKVSMNINSTEACRQLISLGLGWSILPDTGAEKKDTYSLQTTALSYKDGTPLVRRTWILYRQASLQIPVVKAFVEHLKSRCYTNGSSR